MLFIARRAWALQQTRDQCFTPMVKTDYAADDDPVLLEFQVVHENSLNQIIDIALAIQ
jgi:hypothetical protein